MNECSYITMKFKDVEKFKFSSMTLESVITNVCAPCTDVDDCHGQCRNGGTCVVSMNRAIVLYCTIFSVCILL